MDTAHNIAALRRFMEKGFNGQDLAEFDRYFRADLVDHALPPNLPPGLAGRKLFAQAFFQAFPDAQVTLEDVVADGNRVSGRWTATGTHTGELMGIPASGKSIRITGILIDRFEGGQSVEHWEVYDQLGLMMQIGAIPAPASPGGAS